MLLFAAIGMTGCASTTQVDSGHTGTTQLIADKWPTWAGGEPADTPARATHSAYPNVFDSPPPRSMPTLSAEQQAKAAAELDGLRKRVSDQVKAAKAFDEHNTAAALSNVTKGQVAGGVAGDVVGGPH
jgi:hypothetical protein